MAEGRARQLQHKGAADRSQCESIARFVVLMLAQQGRLR
jgi:hypothetical protein